ncbi:unnamed protein product [Phytophthora fragariaefolia]|uniref:Unnamed protein product n=1 Tax=Phytophthora fragariaefolia TaxID=1490495 RepID=A0A9W6XIH0_9STRA|nr:unnamed protein product [Phytophthora fragariaefolia]
MESLGATELAVLYDFFGDNDVIGDFILTPRETLQTATELSIQLKNFAVKREFASILSQFDSKRLTLRTFGTVSLLRKVVAKYSRIKRKLAEDDGAASVVELQDEVLRLKRDQQFHSSYWVERVAEVRRERNTAVAQMRSDFVLLMEEREKDISSLRSQVQTLKMELETARASRKTTASRFARPASPDGARHEPPSRPHDGDDELATASGPSGPFGVQRTGPSGMADGHHRHGQRQFGLPSSAFGSKSSQLGKRASGSQSPKSHKKPAPDGVQELPSEWVGSTSPCRPEGVPLPLSPAQSRAMLADYPVVWKDLCRDVKLLMEVRLEYPATLALVGEDKCLHTSFPLDDLTIMLLYMMHWHRLDSASWTKYVPHRYFTVASMALDGLRQMGTHIPEWRVTPGPSLDKGEIDLLDSEDEAEDKAEKDEDYNPHQDLDDGVDDEDEDPDEA